MKKSKLSLCLASSLVAAMTLVACNDVKAKDGAIVTITDGNGQKVDILTDAAYSKYKTETDGVSKFYNAILEALIRYEYENENSGIRGKKWTKAIKTVKEITDEAQSKVDNDKDTAKENSETNDTSYEDEWNDILKSHNCEDEKELLEYYIYQLEKEDISDKFLIQQKDTTLLNEWIGLDGTGQDVKGKAKAAFPYHIRHVLASISGGGTDFSTGTITSAEAKKLGDIMKAFLNDDYSFGRVALELSGDEGSAKKSGDVGLMSTTTSFVNEFKLGIYAYDAIYTHQDNGSLAIVQKGLGIDNTYNLNYKRGDGIGIRDAWGSTSGIRGGKIQTVPFDAFIRIGNLAETEKDNGGKQVNKGNEHYYPRNVLYNYYLNFHNPFVITKQALVTEWDETGVEGCGLATDIIPGEYASLYSFANFKSVNIGGTPTEVLTDGEGHVIIGVRSEHGVHFMIMEKNVFNDKAVADVSPDPTKVTTLAEYYTSLTPSDSGFPKTADNKNKETYVTSLPTNEESELKSRANDIKSAVQSFDSTYDYRLYQYILDLEGDNVAIYDKDLQKAIKNYIDLTRETNNDNAYKTLNEAWRSYTELVALQYDVRGADFEDSPKSGGPKTRMIHPRCALGFYANSGDASFTDVGGTCYYED